MDVRPVGIMDSGLGGISVLKVAARLLPNENFVFYGDNARAPYGDKMPHEIERMAFECASLLTKEGVKAILIACNTATGAAVEDMRRLLKLPILSMEPAIKPALEQTAGHVIMLATNATCSMERYKQLKARLDTQGRVIDVPATELVTAVEKGLSDQAIEDILARLLSSREGLDVGAIVLGCTHFPFISRQIAQYAALHFAALPKLFDGAGGTARQLAQVLCQEDLLSPGPGGVKLLSSGGPDCVAAMSRLYEA